MRIAALDLGSNSLKLLVADVDGSGHVHPIDEAAIVTRVGERLDTTGEIAPTAMDRTFSALADYVARARAHHVDAMRCVATAGLRGARNAGELLRRAKDELGLEIEVIGGGREAELAFRGAASALGGNGPVIILDLGGRSTELVLGELPHAPGQPLSAISLEIGAVRLTERHLHHDPPEDRELEACRAHVRAELAKAPGAPASAQLAGVSGTILALLGLALGIDDIAEVARAGATRALTRAEVRRAYEDLRRVPAKDRVRGSIIPPGRADVIVAGCLIADEVLERYDRDAMTVTSRGVRYGVALELAQAAP